jgi:putative membrane protein
MRAASQGQHGRLGNDLRILAGFRPLVNSTIFRRLKTYGTKLPRCEVWRIEMSERRDVHLASGLLAGIAGGLVASWIMNEFMAKAGPSLQKAVQRDDSGGEEQEPVGPKPDDATMKTADAVVSTVTGGRHLSHEGREKGGPIVHYAFGALMGATYGAIAEGLPEATFGFGTAFGAALFAGADLVAVPALNLSGSPADAPVSSLATPLAAHLVYGTVTEAVRRLVRLLL